MFPIDNHQYDASFVFCCNHFTGHFCTCVDANHDPPEIHRLVPNYGSSSGGETIAIIGTRMHSRE